MKPKETKPSPNSKEGEAPDEETIITGLRDADRFYQGSQHQAHIGKLIEQVRLKLAKIGRAHV